MNTPSNDGREYEERIVWDAMCRAGLYEYATTIKCCPGYKLTQEELAWAKRQAWECADATAAEVLRRLENGSHEIRSDEMLDAARSPEVQRHPNTMRAYEVWILCGIQFAHDRQVHERRYGLERAEDALRIYRLQQ